MLCGPPSALTSLTFMISAGSCSAVALNGKIGPRCRAPPESARRSSTGRRTSVSEPIAQAYVACGDAGGDGEADLQRPSLAEWVPPGTIDVVELSKKFEIA